MDWLLIEECVICGHVKYDMRDSANPVVFEMCFEDAWCAVCNGSANLMCNWVPDGCLKVDDGDNV